MSEKGLQEEAARPDWETRSALADLPAWKLEDAKARFSEVVRRARGEGPQRVTVRGEDAVVVMAAEGYEQLSAGRARKPGLVEFLRNSSLGELEPRREKDRGRDLPF